MKELKIVPIDNITTDDANQPRHKVEIKRLAASIKAQGLQSPIVVRPDLNPNGELKYRVIDGHRRLAACQKAGIEQVECLVCANPKEADEYMQALALNALGETLTQRECTDYLQQHFELLDDIEAVKPLVNLPSGDIEMLKDKVSVVKKRGIDVGQMSIDKAAVLNYFNDPSDEIINAVLALEETQLYGWLEGVAKGVYADVNAEAIMAAAKVYGDKLGITQEPVSYRASWDLPDGYQVVDEYCGHKECRVGVFTNIVEIDKPYETAFEFICSHNSHRKDQALDTNKFDEAREEATKLGNERINAMRDLIMTKKLTNDKIVNSKLFDYFMMRVNGLIHSYDHLNRISDRQDADRTNLKDIIWEIIREDDNNIQHVQTDYIYAGGLFNEAIATYPNAEITKALIDIYLTYDKVTPAQREWLQKAYDEIKRQLEALDD